MNNITTAILLALMAINCSAAPSSFREALSALKTKGVDDYLNTYLEFYSVPRSTVFDLSDVFKQPIDMSRTKAWEPFATFKLRLKWGDVQKGMFPHFEALANSDWKPDSTQAGLSRTRIRILGSMGFQYVEFYISLKHSSILYEGSWFIVDEKVLVNLIEGIKYQTTLSFNDLQ